MATPTKPTREVKQLVRLTDEQYQALKRQLPPNVVTAQTTPTQAAWQLGVAHVLELLKDGYVV